MRNIFYSLTGIMLLLGITACSEEERYATSVVKEIQTPVYLYSRW